MSNQKFINPFVGLRPFEPNESHLFFGREVQINDIISNLKNHNFTSVIGYSGSGKSSIIKSGLIPKVKSSKDIGPGKEWNTILFRPGINPIQNLCKSIIQIQTGSDHSVKELVDSFFKKDKDIISGIIDDLKQSKNNTLIILDQFEELFSFIDLNSNQESNRHHAQIFVNAIIEAVNHSNKNIYIVLTMRSEFLGRCTEFKGLPEILNTAQYLIPRMTSNELQQVIEGPLNYSNIKISDDLVKLLLQDVVFNQDQLPVLQHALMRTIQHWNMHSDNDTVGVDDYNHIGGMDLALSNHVDEAYLELSENQKITAEKIFKSLVNFSDTTNLTRRPTTLLDLMHITGFERSNILEVINVFRSSDRSFLVPKLEQKIVDNTFIDISHESLLRLWIKLRKWIKEERESIDNYIGLSESAALYQIGKVSLLTNPELQMILNWRATNEPSIFWANRIDDAFPRAINYLEQSEEDYKHSILVKEKQQALKIKRTKQFSYAISVFFVISLLFGLYSIRKKQEADRNFDEAVKSKNIAIEEQNKALASERKARDEESKARVAEQNANEQRQIALENAKEAIRQRKIAEVQEKQAINNAEEAKRQETIAIKNADLARIQEKKAKQQQKLAEENEKEANRLKELAESVQEAFMSTKSLDQNNKKIALEYALSAHNKFKNNSNEIRNADIYEAMNRTLIEVKNYKYYTHSCAIKSIVYSNNYTNTTFLDEEGYLFYSGVNSSGYNNINFEGEPIKFELIKSLGSSSHIVLSKDNSMFVFDSKTGSITNQFDLEFDILDFKVLKANLKSLLVVKHQNFNAFYLLEANKLEKLNFDFKFDTTDNIYVSSNLKHLILSKDNVINIYTVNVESNNLVLIPFSNATGKFQSLSCLFFSEKNGLLAVGYEDGIIETFRLITDKSLSKHVSFNNHSSRVSKIEFISNSMEDILISTSYDNTIKLSDFNNSNNVTTLRGHQSWINDMIYNKSDATIQTVSEDRTLRSWFIYPNDIEKLLKE